MKPFDPSKLLSHFASFLPELFTDWSRIGNYTDVQNHLWNWLKATRMTKLAGDLPPEGLPIKKILSLVPESIERAIDESTIKPLVPLIKDQHSLNNLKNLYTQNYLGRIVPEGSAAAGEADQLIEWMSKLEQRIKGFTPASIRTGYVNKGPLAIHEWSDIPQLADFHPEPSPQQKLMEFIKYLAEKNKLNEGF